MRRLFLAMLLTTAPAWAVCTAASGYSFVQAVTLAAPSATLTDFPQPFYTGGSNLSSLATALAANAQADGDDIIFRTEADATIAHTLVHWDEATGHWFGYLGPLTRTGELVVCVNYGNAGATSTSSTTPLAAVEVLTAKNALATDFTGNGHWPTESGTPGEVAGPVGPAWDFDESVPQYLTLTDSGSSGEIDSTTTFRVSILLKGDAATTESDAERVIWRNTTTTSQRWPIMIWGDTGGGNGTIGKQGTPISTYGPLAADTWYYVTVVYDDAVADNSRAWVNGVLVDTDTPAFGLSTPTSDIQIGGQSSASVSWSGSVGLFLMGLTTAGGSDAWQAYEYASLLEPNTVFSMPAAAFYLKPTGSIRLMRIALSASETSVLCQSATTDLGGGSCPATEFGQHIILGDGR